MASAAVSGIGSKFERKDPSSAGGLYVPIAEITSISGPSRTRSTIDVTSFDSDQGFKEFITGLREAGDITLESNFTDAGFALLDGDFGSETRREYRITLPPSIGKAMTFLGLVATHGVQVQLDDKIAMPFTVKISGPVAYGVVTAPKEPSNLYHLDWDDDDLVFPVDRAA